MYQCEWRMRGVVDGWLEVDRLDQCDTNKCKLMMQTAVSRYKMASESGGMDASNWVHTTFIILHTHTKHAGLISYFSMQMIWLQPLIIFMIIRCFDLLRDLLPSKRVRLKPTPTEVHRRRQQSCYGLHHQNTTKNKYFVCQSLMYLIPLSHWAPSFKEY